MESLTADGKGQLYCYKMMSRKQTSDKVFLNLFQLINKILFVHKILFKNA